MKYTLETIPRRLCIVPGSPHVNVEAASQIEMVLVDGVEQPPCISYSIDEGWSKSIVDGIWQNKVYGVVTLRLKS